MTEERKSNPQPSETQELANAAYVWVRECQLELSKYSMNVNADPISVKWYFDRYWRAVEREAKLSKLAKEENKD